MSSFFFAEDLHLVTVQYKWDKICSAIKMAFSTIPTVFILYRIYHKITIFKHFEHISITMWNCNPHHQKCYFGLNFTVPSLIHIDHVPQDIIPRSRSCLHSSDATVDVKLYWVLRNMSCVWLMLSIFKIIGQPRGKRIHQCKFSSVY